MHPYLCAAGCPALPMLMKPFTDTQTIRQLEGHKGGYSYLVVPATAVQTFPKPREVRFVCTIDKQFTIQCGLNHLGDGNYFVIVSSKQMKVMGKQVGETVRFTLQQDPDPLGVPMPEVLEALLEQDEALKAQFGALTMGKKRMVIHAMNRVKDLDKQINTAIKGINGELGPRRKKV